MHFLYKIDRMKEKELLEETMELTVQINEKSARLQTLDQKIQIQFQPAITQLQRESIQLYTDKKGKWCLITETLPEEMLQSLVIDVQEVELPILRNLFANEYFKGEYAIPKHYQKAYLPIIHQIAAILLPFHIQFDGKPKRPGQKAQHRFKKEFATIPFYVDDFNSKATIYWQKRNEFRILAGATLVPEAPLNKDGSLGFGARFALTLRQEQADKIKDNVTTEDIILKSVNEVGHFLYFAGTNSWLVLKDENGKTIGEYSVVK